MMVAPSVLSADFGQLAKEVESICQAGCDLVHVDVMDGHFVPNLTIGPVVVDAISKASTKPLDIHLMVENNRFFVDLFVNLSPMYITFHIEEEKHPHRLIEYIKSQNIKAGVVLNPHSSVDLLEYIIQDVDMVLLMSVNPGFGGQKFIDSVIKKASVLKDMIIKENSKALIEVDGGVNDKNIDKLADAGVDIVVAGSYVFGSEDYKRAIDSLKK